MRQHPGHQLDGRKRARGAPPVAAHKRRRSVAWHLCSGGAWARAAERLREEWPDNDLDEAVAALLAIGVAASEEQWQPRSLGRLQATPEPADELGVKLEELSARSLPGVGAAALAAQMAAMADERWPCASSSGSDASTTVALPPPHDGGSCRSSFDSTARPAGAQQARLVRQGSSQLLGADVLADSLPLPSQPSPALAARTPSAPLVSITTKLGTAPAAAAAAMHASFWEASLWASRARLAGAAGVQLGYNVVSSGVPAPSAAKLPGLQVAAVDALSSQPWARPSKSVAPAPAPHAAPAACCDGSRLLIVTQPPEASESAPPPSRTIVVQSLQPSSPRSWPPSRAGAAAGEGAAVPHARSVSGRDSCDKACERRWQTNWNLDLYSALNPAVVTTGHFARKSSGAEPK